MSTPTTPTPGPWKSIRYDNDFHSIETADEAIQIGEAYDAENARLMAAAPDLLEALKELANLVDDFLEGRYDPDSFTTQPARLAIAKARVPDDQ